jgi:hypothetical protein
MLVRSGKAKRNLQVYRTNKNQSRSGVPEDIISTASSTRTAIFSSSSSSSSRCCPRTDCTGTIENGEETTHVDLRSFLVDMLSGGERQPPPQSASTAEETSASFSRPGLPRSANNGNEGAMIPWQPSSDDDRDLCTSIQPRLSNFPGIGQDQQPRPGEQQQDRPCCGDAGGGGGCRCLEQTWELGRTRHGSAPRPIARSNSEHGLELMHQDQEYREATDRYDRATWRLYNRITSYRTAQEKRQKNPAAIPGVLPSWSYAIALAPTAMHAVPCFQHYPAIAMMEAPLIMAYHHQDHEPNRNGNDQEQQEQEEEVHYSSQDEIIFDIEI